MSNTHYYLSSCAPYSETAAANPMRAYSKEDCAEIIAHEGGTAYVLAEDHERELAAVTRERDEARAEVERLRVRLVGKRAIFQAGRDSYKTNCQPMNTDDEAWTEFVVSQEAKP